MKQHLLILLFGYMSTLNFVSTENAVLREVYLRYYYGENRTAYVRYKLNETTSMLKHESFRIGQLFKLYVSGWQEKINEAPTTIDIIDSFLSHQKENFVVLDYDKMAAEFYPFAVGNVEGLAEKVALALSDLFTSDPALDPASIHCIGFSMGTQICSAIARSLRTLNPTYRLRRISGLDPAGPLFEVESENVGLCKYDADFVDVIHTDAGMFGQAFSSGDADFYPNNGKRPHPGCPTGFDAFLKPLDHCDHDKAPHYYAATVRGEKYVGTVKNSKNTALMGYFCPKNATGNFYLTIN